MLHSQNTSAVTTPAGVLFPRRDRQIDIQIDKERETHTLRAPETKLLFLFLCEEERMSNTYRKQERELDHWQ